MIQLLGCSLLTIWLACSGHVDAHGFVSKIVADGTESVDSRSREHKSNADAYRYSGFIITKDPYKQPAPPDRVGWSSTAIDLGFIDPANFGSADMICHKNSKNAKLYAEVAAGGSITLTWAGGGDNYKWPDSHHGPVLDYLARCDNDDCTTTDKANLKFFKIDEDGFHKPTPIPGSWASDDLIAAGNTWKIKIPSDIQAGSYVLRHEIIALHSANQENGAQAYPQCFNLKITGGGSATPAGVLGTALYDKKDPGILINIYTTLASYEIPGPSVYAGGDAPLTGSSSSSSSTSSTMVPSGKGPSDSTATTTTTAKVSGPSNVPPPGPGPVDMPGKNKNGTDNNAHPAPAKGTTNPTVAASKTTSTTTTSSTSDVMASATTTMTTTTIGPMTTTTTTTAVMNSMTKTSPTTPASSTGLLSSAAGLHAVAPSWEGIVVVMSLAWVLVAGC